MGKIKVKEQGLFERPHQAYKSLKRLTTVTKVCVCVCWGDWFGLHNFTLSVIGHFRPRIGGAKACDMTSGSAHWRH